MKNQVHFDWLEKLHIHSLSANQCVTWSIDVRPLAQLVWTRLPLQDLLTRTNRKSRLIP